MWSVSHVTCFDLIAQFSLTRLSIFLFLDEPTLKLRIIIILLAQQKIKLPSPKTCSTTLNCCLPTGTHLNYFFYNRTHIR